MQPPSPQDPLLDAYRTGQVIAYPTEAVVGLGCDPVNRDAVMALLALKHRPQEKGLIVVASNYSQLLPLVNDAAIPMDRRTQIFSSWPGPVTWLLPKSTKAPVWVTGNSDYIAVRVSAHSVVRQICDKLNAPLVSTSANVSGQPPLTSISATQQQFGDALYYVEGQTDGAHAPTTIRHGISGEIIRAG